MGFNAPAMLFVIASLAIGMVFTLAVVRGLVALAGSQLTTRRQAFVAYSVFVFAAIFVSACGNADGGPPNFKDSFNHLIVGVLALAVECFYVLKQRPSLNATGGDVLQRRRQM